MGSFFTNILARIFSKAFVGRAASTVLAPVIFYITKYLPNIDMELLTRWTADSKEILALVFAALIGLFVDFKMTKPETPKIVK